MQQRARKANAEKTVPDVPMPTSERRVLGSQMFWTWFLAMFTIAILFFGWELRIIPLPFPMLPRVPPTTIDVTFTIVLIILLSVAAGLFGWQRRFGACPVGIKRTVGAAGTLGGLALLCPVCLALPGLLLSIGTFVAILGQFLPLIRFLAILFAIVAIWMLWPRRGSSGSP